MKILSIGSRALEIVSRAVRFATDSAEPAKSPAPATAGPTTDWAPHRVRGDRLHIIFRRGCRVYIHQDGRVHMSHNETRCRPNVVWGFSDSRDRWTTSDGESCGPYKAFSA